MKTQWRIPDFIDLEYFFIQDKQLAEKEGSSVLRERDRKLYLNALKPLLGEEGEPERSWLIWQWLQERRSIEREHSEAPALLPSRMWYELYGLFWSVLSFFALFSGAGLAWSLLSYSGVQPVNVSFFFLVFVGLQLVILTALFLLISYRRLRGLDLRNSLLITMVSRGLNALLFKVRKYGLGTRGEGRRNQFAMALAAVRTRGKGYGALFSWPLFLLFQLFGIAFNCGVLGVLLIKVAISDLAFGWQSSIRVSAEFVAGLVKGIALPWSWLLGAGSYPNFDQVAGSRMVLKDGFYHLSSTDLVSWWPFLGMAICCYCLLPRVLLFVAGIRGRNRALARVSFQRPDHNQLVHRLLSPRLEVRLQQKEQPQVQPVFRSNATSSERMGAVAQVRPGAAVNGSLLALIPDELFSDCDVALLDELSRQTFGYNVTDTVRINEEYRSDVEVLNFLRGEGGRVSSALLIIQEAWQPPIREMLSFLRSLRLELDEETTMIVALVGKPNGETMLTPVSENDLRIWRQGTAGLMDPCLQVTALVPD